MPDFNPDNDPWWLKNITGVDGNCRVIRAIKVYDFFGSDPSHDPHSYWYLTVLSDNIKPIGILFDDFRNYIETINGSINDMEVNVNRMSFSVGVKIPLEIERGLDG